MGAEPFEDAAGGMLADATGFGDSQHPLIEQRVEGFGGCNRGGGVRSGRDSDGASALASQFGGGGEFASEDRDHAGGAVGGVVMQNVAAAHRAWAFLR